MTRADLTKLVDDAGEDELEDILGDLERAKARALRRMLAPKPANVDDDELLTMDQVAQALDIGETNARELGRTGALPTVTVGERGVRVRRGALREYIRRNERGAMISRGRRG